MRDEDEADADAPLRADEIVARGGTFSGFLFDNPFIRLKPALTWSFDFDCEDVVRDGDSSLVSASVSWLPMDVPGWKSLAPRRAAGEIFAEPAESSVYYYAHHRYDAFELVLQEQRGAEVLVTLKVSGDLDGLGLDSVSVTAWLRFVGIAVQLSDVNEPTEALHRLASLTDTQGLVLRDSPNHANFHFDPAAE